jgi:hypothetical protein
MKRKKEGREMVLRMPEQVARRASLQIVREQPWIL